MRVARSGVGWLLAKYTTLGISFLAILYFTRELPNPTRTLGKFQLFETALSLVMLTTSAGLGTAVVKRISEGESPGAITGAAFRITLFLLLGLSALLLSLSGLLENTFGFEFFLLVWLVVTIWGKQIAEITADVLKGYGYVGRSGLVELSEMGIRTVLQVGLVYLGFELYGLVGGAAVGTIAAAGVAIYMMPKQISAPDREHYQSLFSFTKYTLVRGFAGKVYNNIDVIVIAWFLGNSAVALYAVPFRITLALDAFSSSIRSSVLPALSESDSDDDRERIKQLLSDSLVFSTILAIPALAGVAVLRKPLIVTLFTSEFASGAIIAVFAMAIQIPQAFRTVGSTALDGVDSPEISLRGDIILIIFNIILDIFLVPILGIVGAAIGTMIASTASAGYYLYKTVDVLDLDWEFVPTKSLGFQAISAVLMAVAVDWTFVNIQASQTISLFASITVGVVLYMSVLLTIDRHTRAKICQISADILA